jgi:exopolyphosphatase/guanosine-5'-triphosphate,3'-diphosphate pyrophosphatase
LILFGERTDLEPMGVVDIGSNSVRLVVYEGAVRSPTQLFNEKVLCGLGRELASTGRLDETSVRRALDALLRFRAIIRTLGVKNVRAIATAACRDAANGPEFIAHGERALGSKIQVLTGEQEAELAAKGILMGFENPDGFAGDLGGGSLELIDISGNNLRQAATLGIGGLRLMDASAGRLEKAADIVDHEMAALPWLGKGRDRTFYAVGGTWRSFARLHMNETNYPLHVMHGYAMPAKDVIAFCEDIRKAKKLPTLKEIARARREVLPYGALVLERVVRLVQPSQVVFSVFGIREGLVYNLLSAAERRKDPLLAFASDYARLRSRSPEHAAELGKWTDALFAPPGPSETEDERRLRYAACLLSDISWRAHPDYRAEQSLILIAQSALGGIDHPGRVFLAMAIYFRHLGVGRDAEEGDEDRLPERLKRLLSKRAYRRAKIIGAAIRAAHMLSVGRPGIIDEIPLTYEKDKLVLTLPRAHAALDGERVRRRFSALAEQLERTLEVRFS